MSFTIQAHTKQRFAGMNNNVHVVATATDATPPGGWQVVGVADFNRDGHPDYLLFGSTSRATVIWYMNNNVLISQAPMVRLFQRAGAW